jgi:CelD/BcsL family acetyltransferase involved in cellulose biosynthesis
VTRATPLIAFRTASLRVDAGHPGVSRWADVSRDLAPAPAPSLGFGIYTDFEVAADEWRSFESIAECTPFQSFEWLAAWQRHIGMRERARPVIVVGRFANGATACIFPLAIAPGRWSRRLCWLGQELCDYNAPLLAREFSQRVTPERFLSLWDELKAQMQSDPRLRFDRIVFEKMPQTVGAQINPFTYLGVMPNANSAYITLLGDDWETFYRAKRSSATRRRDRVKRTRMAQFGDICFTTATEADHIRQTFDTLWEQKRRIFAHKGISDCFARPGCREFFADFATNPNSRHLAHVSRVDIGPTCAAVNFGIAFGDCYYHVLTSYCDGELSRHGPGTLHLRELLAYAIGRKLRRFDFTIGDERYKLEWSDQRLNLYDYGTAARWHGWPASLAWVLQRRLKRFIKQTPPLWHVISRLRSLIGPF